MANGNVLIDGQEDDYPDGRAHETVAQREANVRVEKLRPVWAELRSMKSPFHWVTFTLSNHSAIGKIDNNVAKSVIAKLDKYI